MDRDPRLSCQEMRSYTKQIQAVAMFSEVHPVVGIKKDFMQVTDNSQNNEL